MKQWLDSQMPNFVESIRHGTSDLTKFQEKATKHGLPQVLLFTSKAKTSPLTKYLSTEFRRKILLGEVYPTKKNQEIMQMYGITTETLPALLVIPPLVEEEEDNKDSNNIIRYDDDGYTKNKLQSFLSKHALKDKVYPKKKKEEKVDASGGGGGQGDKSSTKQQHTEF